MASCNTGSSSRSNHSVVFLKITVLKNFEMFTVKYLCRISYLMMLQAVYLKLDQKDTPVPEYRFNIVLVYSLWKIQK